MREIMENNPWEVITLEVFIKYAVSCHAYYKIGFTAQTRETVRQAAPPFNNQANYAGRVFKLYGETVAFEKEGIYKIKAGEIEYMTRKKRLLDSVEIPEWWGED